MEVDKTLREMEAYYKARYQKAIAIGINENSKHYAAFQEIELRYFTLSLFIVGLDILKKKVYGDGVEKYYNSFLAMILKQLTLNEAVINAYGKKEYLPYRIILSKYDSEAVEAHSKAREALNSVRQMDYTMEDKELMLRELKEQSFYIINWCIIARERVFSVNRTARKPA